MNESAVHFSTVFMAFFAIMNPIANAPVFMSLTSAVDAGLRRGIAIRSVALAFVIVAGFAIGGDAILNLFGITLYAFRIAGGGMVGLVGFHMLQGEHSSVHASTPEDNRNSRDSALSIAITPLAMPILAGPGTIATAISFAAGSTLPEISVVLGAFGLNCALTCVAFIGAERLSALLGANGIKVVTRLMGMILSVVGVQMIVAGIRGAIAAGG